MVVLQFERFLVSFIENTRNIHEFCLQILYLYCFNVVSNCMFLILVLGILKFSLNKNQTWPTISQ